MKMNKQKGFTLVEIAIVLVIIGLLLGGILKGQELINGARVRNLADQNSGVQAAYYGFIDRYRQVPGDMTIAAAIPAIGATVFNGGDGDGGVDNSVVEATAVWEQLARANFLSGGFTLPTALATTEALYLSNGNAPINAYNAPLILTRNDGYTGSGGVRLNLHLGKSVPVSISRELDIKLDDGLPNSGVLRLTEPSTVAVWAISKATNFATCTTEAGVVAAAGAAGDGADTTDIFDTFDDAQDCGQVFLY
jgi:prepilin-type N-terminal cleavage/methylation domain-containing protein